MDDYTLVTNPNEIKFNRDELLKKQSVQVEGRPGVRRSPIVGENEYVEYLFDDAKTVIECFLRGLRVSDNGPCYGYRPGKKEVPYEWISYQDVWDRAQMLASGMLDNYCDCDDMVGIYSQNNPEWGIMDKACSGYSIVSIPLYDTLGELAIKFIINQCQMKVVMVDTNEKAQKLINYQKNGDVSTLRYIMIIDEPSEITNQLLDGTKITVCTMASVEEMGKKNPIEPKFPGPDDTYTISYTSGTSGVPKGVVLSNRMVVADASGANTYQVNFLSKITKHDIHLSYLPLPHIFERVVQIMFNMHGCSIGFFRGDPKLLFSDAAELKPTSFNMVPRVLVKLHGKIMAGVNQSFIKSKLFNFAMKRKMVALSQGELRTDTIWDKLVFQKTQALIGGRVRFCITGAAPVTAEVLNFCRVVFGVKIIEAYGQTEGSGGFTATLPGDYSGGNVGSVFPGCQIKLIDIEDMNYFAKDDKGEIVVRGPCVMKGYYKDPEKTREVIDEEGWLHTGDVGQWLPNGALKIIDRKKHIFKLSQGEYIAPEKIEQIYVMMSPISQVFVYGDSLKSCLVGIVVPDEETIFGWCKSKGVKVGGDLKKVCASTEVKELLLNEMISFGKQNDLKSFENVRNIILHEEAFSLQNNLITPTLKTKRKELEKLFSDDIKKLYENLE